MSLEALNNFDIDNATATVWVVKKSGGSGGGAPIFTARWVDTDNALDAALQAAVKAARDGIEEVKDYDLLVQNNETSALSISVDETYAALVAQRCADPTADRKAQDASQLSNSDFYVIKLVAGDTTLLAFKKTDRSWRSKTAGWAFAAVYADERLSLDNRPRFSLSQSIDFFVAGAEILILDKGAFESILSYRQAHIEDFASLQQEPEFAAIFTSTEAIALYVGSNKIQLRRASAIKQKAFYKDAGFMARLRAHAHALGLQIEFDPGGKIMATPDNCRDIMQALLDHRLDSRLSSNIYDVDYASQVTP